MERYTRWSVNIARNALNTSPFARTNRSVSVGNASHVVFLAHRAACATAAAARDKILDVLDRLRRNVHLALQLRVLLLELRNLGICVGELGCIGLQRCARLGTFARSN